MCSPGIVETHASVLIFLGDRVYKIKKSVNFPFLDLRTTSGRRAALLSELQLNRRLSPDVYLGVAEFLAPDGESEPVLCMRRLPDDRRLSTLVREGSCSREDVRGVARDLAAFHRSCAAVPAASGIGSHAQLSSLWQDAFDVLARRSDLFAPALLGIVHGLATEYLEGRKTLIDNRRRAGKIRDGHGDLLADDIFMLPDGIRILDCLEFDPVLRCGDTLLDAAFLAMHLELCGSSSLAQAFLDEYRAASEDDAPRSLAHHYIAYRALVRAKVAVLRLEQGDSAAADDARALVQLALDHLKAGQVRLAVVCGLPATGKSTLATMLQDKWRLERSTQLLQSDNIRDELTPESAPTRDGVDAGRYLPSERAVVYRTMLRRAESALESGIDVILDATFTDSWTRDAVEDLGRTCQARLFALQCQVPVQLAKKRLANRVRGAEARSEADFAVYSHLAQSNTTWTSAHMIDTSTNVDDAFNEVCRLIR